MNFICMLPFFMHASRKGFAKTIQIRGKAGLILYCGMCNKYLALMFWHNKLNIQSFRLYELQHEISNNVVCVTSKGSDQPAHTRRLIRVFASRLDILLLLSY